MPNTVKINVLLSFLNTKGVTNAEILPTSYSMDNKIEIKRVLPRLKNVTKCKVETKDETTGTVKNKLKMIIFKILFFVILLILFYGFDLIV